MPTYEYACRACGEHVEVVQSFRDDPLTECGLCGGSLRKVFSAAGIIFKGSGYYVTDSRTQAGGKAPDTAPEKAPEKTSEQTSEGGSTAPGKKKPDASAAESA